MTVYFISDLHLNGQSPTLTALWRHFLGTYAKPGSVIYILGDFFDVWLGDDAADAFQKSIMSDLKQLTDSGVPVYFMVGNRDFLIGPQFAAETGVILLKDPTVLDWPTMRVLLKHGDDLCVQDQRHQWFRRISRSWLIRHAYLALPLKFRRSIADYLRRHSRGNRGYSVLLDADREAVKNKLSQAKADVLIHGHTHRPGIDIFFQKNQRTTRYVLSDWHEQGNFLRLNPLHGFEICYFATT